MEAKLTAPVQPMNAPRVQVLGCTLSETGGRNGGAFCDCVRAESAVEEHLVVVADGVSSSERGPEAAASACTEIRDAFLHGTFRGCDELEEIRELLIHTNRRVRGAYGGNGICSFVAAVWNPRTLSVAVGNVGDSPAYFYRYQDCFEELTEIDRASRVVQINHENVLVNGMPLIQQGLSQAIGQMAEVIPHVRRVAVGDGSGILCLTSDGVSGAQLRQFLVTHHTHLNAEVIREFCDRERVYSQDDTTLLAVIIGDVPLPEALKRLMSYARRDPNERDNALRALKAETYIPASSLVAAFWAEQDENRQRWSFYGGTEGN
jgi:serine/threonine protein phosphatase PrpC